MYSRKLGRYNQLINTCEAAVGYMRKKRIDDTLKKIKTIMRSLLQIPPYVAIKFNLTVKLPNANLNYTTIFLSHISITQF